MIFNNKNIFKTILHLACESGNVELVKYIISLDKIDITSKTILIIIFLDKISIIINLFHFNHQQFMIFQTSYIFDISIIIYL